MPPARLSDAGDADRPGWVSNSNILVVVRCRPMSENERKKQEENVVKVRRRES
jgi:hypothetical protein